LQNIEFGFKKAEGNGTRKLMNYDGEEDNEQTGHLVFLREFKSITHAKAQRTQWKSGIND